MVLVLWAYLILLQLFIWSMVMILIRTEAAFNTYTFEYWYEDDYIGFWCCQPITGIW